MAADGAPARITPASAAGDRVPPHDNEAERSVLGAMMLSQEAAGVAREILVAEDFYKPAHADIFQASVDLFHSGQPTDPITISDQLSKMGALDRIGGRAYVHGLADSVPSAANVEHYADIVNRDSALRQLIRASSEIGALGYAPTDDVQRSLDLASEVLYKVVQRQVKGGFTPLGALVSQAYGELEQAFEAKEHLTGLPTGFADLDDVLSGLKRGELIILAARPSIGKTALALNVAANVARAKAPVAIFSLEMAGEQLAQRMLCAEAEVDPRDVRHGRLKEDKWSELMDAASVLSEMDISVDSSPGLGIIELRTKARRVFAGKRPGLVVIDYLQLMQPAKRLTSRQQEIAEISRGLKLMAQELECPILALSQLNRAIEQRDVKRPQLSDLRESGSLEQDADVVVFLHRDIYGPSDDEDDPKKRVTEIHVAKNRNGPVSDEIRLTFQTPFTRFINYAPDSWSD